MKMQEVRAKAKALGLKNTFGLSKMELIQMIQRAEGKLLSMNIIPFLKSPCQET